MHRGWMLLAASLLAAAPAQAASDDDVVYDIPLGDSPRKGPENAKITVIEFGDFQCPFCGRAEATLAQLQVIYDGEIRFVFKHNPLPFHDHARLAAQAAIAAGEQGRFWEMHDLLFKNQQRLDRADLEDYATQLGLDMNRFRAALDAQHARDVIDHDVAEAQLFQAVGTPTFFVNGRRFAGAQPRQRFEAVIDQEMKRANEALADGAPRAHLYDALVKGGQAKAEAPARVGSQAVANVTLGDSPHRGATTPKVVIVEWGDFQCPFCAKAKPTMDALLSAYPDVQLVFKHEPLPFHPRAMPAALAAEAARNQGRFWEFHDLVYANQQSLRSDDDAIDHWAKQLKLDMSRFRKDMEDPATRARVEADVAAGKAAGADGTPTFFIDGRILPGALPYDTFETAVVEELKKANALLDSGVPRQKLYDRLLADNLANAVKPPPKPAPKLSLSTVYAVPVADAAVLGTESAKVTIVEFADFQCPFSNRVLATLKQVRDKYGSDVRLVFKHNPLSFHPNAFRAAEAALAAGELGHFWDMHEMLFENSSALGEGDIESYAQLLQLDMTRFDEAMRSHRFKAQIERDQHLATELGATGTPTFFINGRPLVGAQPFEQFDKLIAEEKAHAEKLRSTGVLPKDIYAAALKDSHAVDPDSQ